MIHKEGKESVLRMISLLLIRKARKASLSPNK
jgi:hypothetical protein